MEEKIQDAGSVGQAPRGYWILITGQAAGTNRYAWSQVNDADTGFGTSLGAGFAMSGTSATTGWPAYEINGRQDVPADSTVRVLAFPSAAGTYWIFEYEGTAGGSGTAGTYPGWYMGLTTSDCLVMTVISAAGFCSSIDTTQVIYLQWSAGDSAYVGVPDFTHDTGSGTVKLSVSSGEPTLTIDGITLALELKGNGYLIFAGGGTTLCDGTSSQCADNTFRVRIECSQCVVATDCCPDDVTPQNLFVTISNLNNGSAAGPFDLVYDVANGWWFASGTYANTLCAAGDYAAKVWLVCDTGTWKIYACFGDGAAETCPTDVIGEGTLMNGTPSVTCSPFQIVNASTSVVTCYSGGANITFTITE